MLTTVVTFLLFFCVLHNNEAHLWDKVSNGLKKGIEFATKLITGATSGKIRDSILKLNESSLTAATIVESVFEATTVKVEVQNNATMAEDPKVVKIVEELKELSAVIKKFSVERELTTELIKSELRLKALLDAINDMQVLQIIYNRFLTENSTEFLDNFQRSCDKSHELPARFVNFMTNDPYSYKELLFKDNNEKTYTAYLWNIEMVLQEAITLESSCMSVKNQGKPKAVLDSIRERLKEAGYKCHDNILQATMNDFKYYMFDAAKNIVDDVKANFTDEDNNAFGELVIGDLRRKLDSSKFYFISYTRNAILGEQYNEFHPPDKDSTVRMHAHPGDMEPEPSFFHHWTTTSGHNYILVRKGSIDLPVSPELQNKCAKTVPKVTAVCDKTNGTKNCELVDCKTWVNQTTKCLGDANSSYIAVGCFYGSYYEIANFVTGKIFFTEKDESNYEHGRFIVW